MDNDDTTLENEASDPTLIVRTFSAEVAVGEGRTADVRIVPWGERATVADGHGGIARGLPYQEEFAPGAFDHQITAAHRLTANCEHEEGIGGVVARGIALRSSADGLYGSFKFLGTPNGDTALELVREGVFDGVSLEAYPARSKRLPDGTIQRVKAHLRAIAFCRTPAYAGARVLALREGRVTPDEFILDEELTAPSLDPAVVARAKALGIKVPTSMAERLDA